MLGRKILDFTGKTKPSNLTTKYVIDLTGDDKSSNLTGKFLIASPFVGLNDLFDKSLIYIAEHSVNGVVGLIVNNPIDPLPCNINITKMFFNKKSKRFESDELNQLANDAGNQLALFLGGPIDPERGFIIHSSDYQNDCLAKCSNDILISCSPNTLEKILDGSGPKSSLVVMGYTGWRAGQLEKEMAENLWVVTKGDANLMFQTPHELQWSAALKQVGVYEALFCGQIGRG
jgi:putative transcriptional regulator